MNDRLVLMGYCSFGVVDLLGVEVVSLTHQAIVDMEVILVGHDWLGLVLVEVDKRTRIALATTVGHCFWCSSR